MIRRCRQCAVDDAQRFGRTFRLEQERHQEPRHRHRQLCVRQQVLDQLAAQGNIVEPVANSGELRQRRRAGDTALSRLLHDGSHVAEAIETVSLRRRTLDQLGALRSQQRGATCHRRRHVRIARRQQQRVQAFEQLDVITGNGDGSERGEQGTDLRALLPLPQQIGCEVTHELLHVANDRVQLETATRGAQRIRPTVRQLRLAPQQFVLQHQEPAEPLAAQARQRLRSPRQTERGREFELEPRQHVERPPRVERQLETLLLLRSIAAHQPPLPDTLPQRAIDQ
jgi:hypothetical protein